MPMIIVRSLILESETKPNLVYATPRCYTWRSTFVLKFAITAAGSVCFPDSSSASEFRFSALSTKVATRDVCRRTDDRFSTPKDVLTLDDWTID